MPKKPVPKPQNGPGGPKSAALSKEKAGVKIRMYRQGLGDCFLITLPRDDGSSYFIMIDCGVILGTAEAVTTMKRVVDSIITTTRGHIDLLIATHEHWDHLSGFVQAKELFSKLKVDKVWLAWTEDPSDPLANELRGEHEALRMALASAGARMRMSGAGDSNVDTLLEFFGAAGRGTTGEALKVVKDLCDKTAVRFCLPTDDPVDLKDLNARLYVLGPPHDRPQIKRYNPSKSHPETYGAAELYMDTLKPSITEPDLSAPFDPILQIPIDAARQMAFFRTRYWGESPDFRPDEAAHVKKESDAGRPEETTDAPNKQGVPGAGDKTGWRDSDQSWRRIDGDWLGMSSSLAMQLDSATNNTSLVLAIELGNREVLLFVADAQVGNWLSWQDLKWTVEGKEVTGPDLLSRTIFYKTGHHGSHNATLREKGLEMMTNLKIAFIPVDHEMALKKRWGKMPLDEIEKTLNEMTNGFVVRIDKDLPATLVDRVSQGPGGLYFEVAI